MSQRKHYGHFLPEAGRAIEDYANKIVAIQAEIAELEKRIEVCEKEIKDIMSTHWDETEIALAKEIAATHNSKL